MAPIRISIITPVLNGEKFIEFCINNVIDQSCDSLEHIIMDGGSTDKTAEIARQYAQKYPHIRFISEKDKGQSDAMNKGIQQAKGEIISFLNTDDFYEPDTLKFILNIFESLPANSFVFGKCRVLDGMNKLASINDPKSMKLKELLATRTFPNNPSAYFYHKSLHEIIGLYNVDEHYAMDIDFILRISEVAHAIRVDKILGNFRLIEGTKTFESLSSDNAYTRINKLCNAYMEKLSVLDRAEIRLRRVFYNRSYYWNKIIQKTTGK